MALELTTAQMIGLVGFSITTGMLMSSLLIGQYIRIMFRRLLSTTEGKPSKSIEVTREDIRAELARDLFAMELMCNDDTPDDVARYLYFEAERRARLRKQGVLSEDESDLFSPPKRKPDRN